MSRRRSIVDVATRAIAGAASIVPLMLSMKTLYPVLSKEQRDVIGHPNTQILLAYGAAYGTTGGDLIASLIALLVYYMVMTEAARGGDPRIKKFFGVPLSGTVPDEPEEGGAVEEESDDEVADDTPS